MLNAKVSALGHSCNLKYPSFQLVFPVPSPNPHPSQLARELYPKKAHLNRLKREENNAKGEEEREQRQQQNQRKDRRNKEKVPFFPVLVGKAFHKLVLQPNTVQTPMAGCSYVESLRS